MPILLSFVRGRRLIRGTKFYKGKIGFFCNWLVYQLESKGKKADDE